MGTPSTPPHSPTPGLASFPPTLASSRTDELRSHLRVFLLAGIIGVTCGLAAIGFQKLTDVAREGAFWLFGGDHGGILAAASRLAWWQALLLPAAGAAVGALLLYGVFRRKGSYGIADLMETVSLRRGEVRLVDTAARSLAVAAVIGSGGSTGREGPIIQIGSAIASTAGRLNRFSPRDLSVLIACGAAAGMAGAYNAPIGAAMFVMEVILGSFVMETFAPVMVASVTSTLTVRAVVGGAPVYVIPPLTVGSPWEAIPIFVLGILSALAGWLFLRALTLSEDGFARLKLSRSARAVLAGLLVGALGVALPEVWGNGYEAVSQRILPAALPVATLLLLLVAKVVASALTSGGGISGGVFTPTLFVGAALGSAFGSLVAHVLPGADPGVYALVGMGSVLAATTHAPLMSILILFEMTHDPPLIAPLMLGAVTATLFARFVHADSLYGASLRRRGVRLPDGAEEGALLRTYVRDLVRTDAPTLPATAPLDQVIDVFLNTRRDAVYVVTDDRRLVGVARLHDVKSAFASRGEGVPVIALDVAAPVPAVEADAAIGRVLARFHDPELDEVPVVASATSPTFVGSLSRRDILAMLRREVLVEPSRPARVALRGSGASTVVDLPPGWRVVEVRPPDAWVGRPLDVHAWRRARHETPLVVLRTRADGTRGPAGPEDAPLLASDLVVVLVAAPPPSD